MAIALILQFFEDFWRKFELDCHFSILPDRRLNAQFVPVLSIFNSQYISPNIARQYPARSILGVPLIVGTNKLGAAIIAFNALHEFTTEKIERAEQAGAQIAIALWNFQQGTEIQRRLNESNALVEIGRALGETEHVGLNTVLQLIVNSARELIPQAEQAVIHIVDHEEKMLIPYAVSGYSEGALTGSQLGMRAGMGVAGQVIQNGVPINIADIQTDARFLSAGGQQGFRSLLVAPISGGNQQFGTISVQSKEIGAFSKDEEELLKALGIQAAIAIENTRLFETTQKQLKEMDALYKTSRGLATSLYPDELIKDIVTLLQKNFGYYYVQVFLRDSNDGTLSLKMGSGEIGSNLNKNEVRLPSGAGIVGYVAETASAFVTSNVNEVLFFERNPLLPDTQSEMAVPIKIGKSVIGVLDIQERPPHHLTEGDLNLMTAVAEQLAVALQKAELYTDLQTALEHEQTTRSQLLQSERLALAGRLLATVSHELNNPIQAIQNTLYLLKDEKGISDQGSRDLSILLAETERMAALIERLRSVYRPVHAEDFKPIQFNDLVSSVCALVSGQLRHQKIQLHTDLDPKLPMIPGIPDQLKQVVLNLILNAIEATPATGSLMLQTLAAQSEIVFSVKDTGKGIALKILPQLFDAFVTDKSTGTGLGLTIVHDILQRHHGRILAENISEGGAKITIWLPVAMGEQF